MTSFSHVLFVLMRFSHCSEHLVMFNPSVSPLKTFVVKKGEAYMMIRELAMDEKQAI